MHISSSNYNFILTQEPYSRVEFNTSHTDEVAEPSPAQDSLPTTTLSKIKAITNISFKKLKKIDLDGMKLPKKPSPFKKELIIEDDKHAFILRAITFQEEKDITAGRNVAIAVFHSPDSKTNQYVIDTTCGPPGAPHAELKVLDQIPEHVKKDSSNILSIYTQRKPCPGCHRKLSSSLDKENTEISWETPYTPDKKRQRKHEEEFQGKQSKRGIRIADPKVKRSLLASLR